MTAVQCSLHPAWICLLLLLLLLTLPPSLRGTDRRMEAGGASSVASSASGLKLRLLNLTSRATGCSGRERERERRVPAFIAGER